MLPQSDHVDDQLSADAWSTWGHLTPGIPDLNSFSVPDFQVAGLQEGAKPPSRKQTIQFSMLSDRNRSTVLSFLLFKILVFKNPRRL